MIGLIQSIINFIQDLINNISSLIQTIIIFITAPFQFVESVGNFANMAVVYIPELAVLTVIASIGTIFIIINILRDLL